MLSEADRRKTARVATASGVTQIFVRDSETGATTCVSVGPNGSPGNGPSRHAAVSGDGRFVAFESDATNLVASDCTTGVRQVFVRDRVGGTTACVSTGTGGVAGNARRAVVRRCGLSAYRRAASHSDRSATPARFSSGQLSAPRAS